MFPSGTASPPRSAAAAPAGGWREEGRSLARRPLARRGSRQLLGAVAGEPARGTGLILPLSALLVQIEKKKKLFFCKSTIKRNKVPESLSGLRLDSDTRCVRCPPRASFAALPAPEVRGWAARLRERAEGPAAQPGLCRVPHPARGGRDVGCAGEGVAGAGAGFEQPRLWGPRLVVNLIWESRFSFLIIFTCSPCSPILAFPGQPLLSFRNRTNKITRPLPRGLPGRTDGVTLDWSPSAPFWCFAFLSPCPRLT